jgi:hypothetical protein
VSSFILISCQLGTLASQRAFGKKLVHMGKTRLVSSERTSSKRFEQLCITSPDGNDSWEMHEEIEDFYKELA